MNVLVVEPLKEPYNKEIANTLDSLQSEVGGYIEALYPYDDPVALICDEDGKTSGKDLNRGLRGKDGKIYDVIAGKILVVGLGLEDFASLSPELSEKYEKLFHTPELFMLVGKEVIAFPA